MLQVKSPPAAAIPAAPDTGSRLEKSPPSGDAAAFDSALLEPLAAYAQVRSAGFGGWADTGMYIGTQLGRYPQVHRVASPGADRRQLTFFPRRMSGFYLNPRPARADFLFTQDEGGNEQYGLRLYDLKTGNARGLGAPPGRVDGPVWNDSGSRFAYSHTPSGSDRWDIRVGGIDGKDTLALSMPGTWAPMEFSPDGRWLLVQRYVSASQADLHVLCLEDGWLTPVAPMDKGAFSDNAVWIRRPGPQASAREIPWAIAFTSDRDGASHRIFLALPQSHAPSGPSPADAAVQAPQPLSPADRWDVEWLEASPDKRSLIYSLNEDGLSRLYKLDLTETGAGNARALKGMPAGIIHEIHFRPEAGKPGAAITEFGFTLNSAVSPGDAWSYDIAKEKAVRWTWSETGGLPPGSFREPQLIRYPSAEQAPAGADSPPIPAWIYRPDEKKFPGPRPVLILLHGGPEQQARPAFDPFLQYAVGVLGLAVIQPNVRGSSGYGRAWLRADDGFARMNSVRDVGALLKWIRTRTAGDGKAYLDSTRVAVSGRSYGGFLSLSALIEYGGSNSGHSALKAGISTVGITHFPTFLKQTSGYRRDLRRAEYGDERDPRMAAFLDSISPLTRVDRIHTPLLLCHGRNDPRVPYAESERVFAALKARKVPVWFLTFADEGHSVKDQDSQIAQWRVTAEFLARNLGLPAH
ncbi:MAG: peptidase family [Fibrobacteres bacterium]|nr:peptidase family [Fibrobacterota bacterium]